MKSYLHVLLIILSVNFWTFSQNLTSKDSEVTTIEKVPVFNGCDQYSDNASLKECMAKKISEHVAKRFNTDIAKQLGLPKGPVRIRVIFKVDTQGQIIDIRARASHRELENEAARIIELLPPLEAPGYKNGEPVVVPYSLPIIFNVTGSKASKNITQYPIYKGCTANISDEYLKKCSKEKIINFIKMSVDTELASQLFPTDTKTQFQIDFTISKKGNIKDITAKAHHKSMAIEAINAAKRLPKFKAPGYKNGKPVETPFSLLMTIYFD